MAKKWLIPKVVICPLCEEKHNVDIPESFLSHPDPLNQKGLVHCAAAGYTYPVTEELIDESEGFDTSSGDS